MAPAPLQLINPDDLVNICTAYGTIAPYTPSPPATPESPAAYTNVEVVEIFDRDGNRYYIDDNCVLYNMEDYTRFIGRYILTNVSAPGDIMLREPGQYAHVYNYSETDAHCHSCNLEYHISNRDYACLHADVVIVIGGQLEFGHMPSNVSWSHGLGPQPEQ
jgi:hypothetical protein